MEPIHFWEMIAGIIIGSIAVGTIIFRTGMMVARNKGSLDKNCRLDCEKQVHVVQHAERLKHLEQEMDKLETKWLMGHAAVIASNEKLRDLVTEIASNVKVVTEKVNEFIRTFERNKDGGMR